MRLAYRADADRELVIRDLTLRAGQFSVGPNPPDFPGLSVQDLTPQAMGSGSLTFSNVHWVESGAAMPFIEAEEAGLPYQGSIRFVDSQLDLPHTEMYLDPLGSLELISTAVEVLRLGSVIRFGMVTLDSARITAAGVLFFNTQSGMTVSDSTLTSDTSYVQLGHSNEANLFTGTETIISNSQFSSPESMHWWFGTDTRLLIEGSELHSDEEIELYIEDGTLAHINTTGFTSANSYIGLYMFEASEALIVDNVLNAGTGVNLEAHPGTVSTFDRNFVNSSDYFSAWNDGAIFGAEGNTVRMRIEAGPDPVTDAAFFSQNSASDYNIIGNTFIWESAPGGIRLHGAASFTLTHNVITGFENSGTGLRMLRQNTDTEANVTVTDNRFESFQNALHFNMGGSSAGMYDADINNNVFDFPMTAAPQAAMVSFAYAVNTDLNAQNNVWSDLTTLAEVEALITNTTTAVLTVDPVSLPAAP